jgi:hypothetical protein
MVSRPAVIDCEAPSSTRAICDLELDPNGKV